MKNDISTTTLPTSAEFIITTNLKSPIVIIGVATSQIRDSKKDPWRTGYLVFYEDTGVKKKAEINENMYAALHLVFKTIGDIDNQDCCWNDVPLLEGEAE